MRNPLEITFHDISHNEAIENTIQEKFRKINQLTPDITKCHVIVEKLSKHHKTANTACVRLDLKVPHVNDIVISEKCEEDEASLSKALIKVFKRAHMLVREALKHRIETHRQPRADKFNNDVAETDEVEGELI